MPKDDLTEAQEAQRARGRYTQAGERFFTAAAGKPPTPEQKLAVETLRGDIVSLAAQIAEHVPDGHNKRLALVALEDVQMRANRGIFAPDPYK